MPVVTAQPVEFSVDSTAATPRPTRPPPVEARCYVCDRQRLCHSKHVLRVHVCDECRLAWRMGGW